jgi:hypothetical protein
MSLKSQIETAKDAVSKALITALEKKDTSAISNLISCYNNLTSIQIVEPFNIEIGKGSGGIYTNKYESYNIPCAMNDDVISFGGLG